MTDITLYTTTLCPYCHRAKRLLNDLDADFNEINIENQRDKVGEMLERSNGARTVPQIFIGDLHVGGSDDLVALHRAGELVKLLDKSDDDAA